MSMSNWASYAAWFLGGMVAGGATMVLSLIGIAEYQHRKAARSMKPLPRQDSW